MTETSIYGSSRSVIVVPPSSTRSTRSENSHNSDSSQGDVTVITGSQVATGPPSTRETVEHGTMGIGAQFSTNLPIRSGTLPVEVPFHRRSKSKSPPSLPTAFERPKPLESQQIGANTPTDELIRTSFDTEDVNKLNDLLNGLDVIAENIRRRLWVFPSIHKSSFADVVLAQTTKYPKASGVSLLAQTKPITAF
jgi:hypothetical protein